MINKNNFLSILLTTIVSTTSFANDAENQVAEERTSPRILRCIEESFTELKKGHIRVIEADTAVLEEARSLFPTIPRSGSYQDFRAAVLGQKFEKDVEDNHRTKEAALYKKVKDLGLDEDLERQVLVTLKQYSTQIDYMTACLSHKKAYVAHMLALEPIRQDQHRKFITFEYLFSKVLSGKIFMSNAIFKVVQKRNQEWSQEINMDKVASAGRTLVSTKKSLAKVYIKLDEKLKSLLKVASEAQKQRKSLSSKGAFKRMMGRGHVFFKSLYWKGMNKRFGIALGA